MCIESDTLLYQMNILTFLKALQLDYLGNQRGYDRLWKGSPICAHAHTEGC
jgi:hypothetical protein